jgi:hypothetical protein
MLKIICEKFKELCSCHQQNPLFYFYLKYNVIKSCSTNINMIFLKKYYYYYYYLLRNIFFKINIMGQQSKWSAYFVIEYIMFFKSIFLNLKYIKIIFFKYFYISILKLFKNINLIFF